MSGFSLIVGSIASTIGMGEFFGLKLPLFAIALIVIGGAAILLRMMVEKEPISMFAVGHGWSCCGRMMQEMRDQDHTGRAVGR